MREIVTKHDIPKKREVLELAREALRQRQDRTLSELSSGGGGRHMGPMDPGSRDDGYQRIEHEANRIATHVKQLRKSGNPDNLREAIGIVRELREEARR